uniref:Ultraviolet-B receptor UVR8-like n=1 Tax=Rhizophora mucronata TaxID=61149 RepID=A0A2P2LWA6_RHIMU
MALFRHISRAASSDKHNSKSGAKFAGCLKKEHVASSFARSWGSKLQAVRT